MGGAVSQGEDNEELVDNLVEADYVKTPNIESALRAVDRGNYYLEGYRDTAYKDLAWKNGNLHLSAPCIYSEVLESLKLSPGQSFLNLGSGTGYLSTVAGLLLGSYGTNHGVEQHADVVEYANERLMEFLSTSSALDLTAFCRPDFVVGNCLQLEPSCSVQAYDRVYCGAAVPPEHLPYIRNLIKVGGIAVLPSGDQLLRIQRVKEDSWDTKSILPVSFATLVEPTPEERASGGNIILPDRLPLKLQEICRETVRSVLRKRIIEENPGFSMRTVLSAKARRRSGGGRSGGGGGTGSRTNSERSNSDAANDAASRRRRRFIRRILIPVFHGTSDDDDDDDDGDDDHDDHDGHHHRPSNRSNRQQQRQRGRRRNNPAGAGGDDNRDDDGAAGRRSAIRSIVAIGTAGISRRSGGGIRMQGLRTVIPAFVVTGSIRHRKQQASTNDDGGDAPSHIEPTTVDSDAEEDDIRDSLDYEQRVLLSGVAAADGDDGLSHNNGTDGAEQRANADEQSTVSASAATTDDSVNTIFDDSDLPQLCDGDDTTDSDTTSAAAAADDSDHRDHDPPEQTPRRKDDHHSSSTRSVAGSSSANTIPTTTGGGTGTGTGSGTGGGETSKRSHSESEVPETEGRRKRAAATATTIFDQDEDDDEEEDEDEEGGEIPPLCQGWRGVTGGGGGVGGVSTVGSDGGDSGGGGSDDAADEKYREEQRNARHANVAMQKKFSKFMTQKIRTLPVPDPLKAYLNYFRGDPGGDTPIADDDGDADENSK